MRAKRTIVKFDPKKVVLPLKIRETFVYEYTPMYRLFSIHSNHITCRVNQNNFAVVLSSPQVATCALWGTPLPVQDKGNHSNQVISVGVEAVLSMKPMVLSTILIMNTQTRHTVTILKQSSF